MNRKVGYASRAGIIHLLLLFSLFALAQEKAPRPFQYMPENGDIVCVNGNNRYTRALYGGHTLFRLETGDRPLFATFNKEKSRNIRLFLTHRGQRLRLDSTSFCEARYQGGKRTYRLKDNSWGNAQLFIEVLARIDDEGAIWKCSAYGFEQQPELSARICVTAKTKMQRNGDLGLEPRESFDPTEQEDSLRILSWKGVNFSYLLLSNAVTLSVPSKEEGDRIFLLNEKERLLLTQRLSFSTPDPYINTLAPNLCAAADALWDGNTWQHGAIGWRVPLVGWRGAYVGDVLGWHDRAWKHFTAYARSMVTLVEPVFPHPTQDTAQAMARAEKRWGTQMYSNGYICRLPDDNSRMNHYDMNLNFVDELLWHFQYDADTAKMRLMWPLMKSHLAWEKRNFDPDGDYLYDAYCCIWASDALYYNGGAVTHSSAYNYRANRLAARMAELLGEDGSVYANEAEEILKAMNSRLWMEKKGCWAEYQDLMGLKRLHGSAALWSVYTPVDCGACSPEQAFRASRYVDSHIPHIPVRIEGEQETDFYTLSTSDWMPYDWSINNVAHEEVMNMALAFFEAGNCDSGFRLLKSDVLDGMFLGQSPGNFGQISYYDKARSEAYRDFADNVGVASRAIVQGLFGISPQALYGKCVIQPGFPLQWDSCAVTTPYLSYRYTRLGNHGVVNVRQQFAQPLQIVLRIPDGEGHFVEMQGTDELEQSMQFDIPERRLDGVISSMKKDSIFFLGNETGEDGKNSAFYGPDPSSRFYKVMELKSSFNADVDEIFKQQYRSPRPSVTTLQLPLQGIGQWCHPHRNVRIEDNGLRDKVVKDEFDTGLGFSFLTPKNGHNIVYTSLWDNYPDSISFLLQRKMRARAAWLLMAGSTNHMQSRIDNALLLAHYADGSCDTLHLENPSNWCPIEQDYYVDGLAFRTSYPRPLRVHLGSGTVSARLSEVVGVGSFPDEPRKENDSAEPRIIPDGAATILRMPLSSNKRLCGFTLRTLSNDVVVGLMAVTLER